ncbi:unnamed protein product [Orchesella dallaii]|uniref:Uncharacterized protein n=1 Tax=Orchesella dallaii TaxID=48710 RepID=A0ABP1QN10_9HEXA
MEHQNNSGSTHPAATVPPPVQGNVSTIVVDQNAGHPADHQLAEPSVSPAQLADPEWRSEVIREYLALTEANHVIFCRVVREDIAVKDYIINEQLKNLIGLREENDGLKANTKTLESKVAELEKQLKEQERQRKSARKS